MDKFAPSNYNDNADERLSPQRFEEKFINKGTIMSKDQVNISADLKIIEYNGRLGTSDVRENQSPNISLNKLRTQKTFASLRASQKKDLMDKAKRNINQEKKNEIRKFEVSFTESSESSSQSNEVHLSKRQLICRDFLKELNKIVKNDESSRFLQFWKVFIVVLSLWTCFEYCHYAAYLHMIHDESERRAFARRDTIYQVLFILDFILLLLSFRKLKEMEQKSIRKIKWSNYYTQVTIDLIAIFPLPLLLKNVVKPKIHQLLYILKIFRLMRGYQLLEYR